MKNISSLLRGTAACIGFAIPTMLIAQQPALRAVTPVDASVTVTTPVVSTIPAAPSANESKPLTDRWLDLNTLSWAGRYRNTVTTEGRHLYQFGQDRYIADGRVKLDSEGRYSINFHASSGRYFNWAYADWIGGEYSQAVVAARPYHSPALAAAIASALVLDPDGAVYKLGYPTRGGYFYFRQLYASATPVKQVTFEFGSLPIDHGQNSEITSFDDDGYISGERVRVQDPKHLYFDRVGATWAYIGSSLTPNFLARGNDLTRSNYQQYLVEKKLGKHFVASTDFTEIRGTHTWREAGAIKVPESKVIDSVLVELYQRTNSSTISGSTFQSASGFAVSGSKKLFKRLDLGVGYDSVDRYYAVYSGSIYLCVVGMGWNGDSYTNGKRAFAKANLELYDGVTAFGFYTHLTSWVSPPTTVAEYVNFNQGYNAGINFDLKKLINKEKRLF